MGKSVAQFHLPNVVAQQVLATAGEFAGLSGIQIEDRSPNHLTMGEGSKTWTARRHLRVGAWDAQGGTNVVVEAWAETLLVSELNADPHRTVGMIPRRQAWRLAEALTQRLGVAQPEAVVRHG